MRSYTSQDIENLTTYTSQDIENLTTTLQNGNNAYIYYALRQFIRSKFSDIKAVATELFLDDDTVHYLQHKLVTDLLAIDFIDAYIHKKLKPHPMSEFDIDPESLEKHIYKECSHLENTKDYVLKNIRHVDDKRQELLSHIQKVKKTINHYNNDNKKHLVQDFNAKIDKFYSSLRTETQKNIETQLRAGLTNLLHDLEKKETNYYNNLRFFPQARKANSTLQTKINDAWEHVKKAP